MNEDNAPCCAASRSTIDRDVATKDPDPDSPGDTTDERPIPSSMVELDGGTFTMGTDSDSGYLEDGEGPAREVTVDPLFVDRHAVTVADFAQFVDDTGYITDAQRYGWSFVFRDFIPSADSKYMMQPVADAPWWVAVESADWMHPYGPSSAIRTDRRLLEHPVTHVSWNDATAYAEWAGKRLPTEAEWEYLARGGVSGTLFPWGDELTPDGEHRCNIWQGSFPDHNTAEDGYARTAPVDAFDPNGFGVYNVVGNVWEWCADWFSPTYHQTPAYDPDNPTGPPSGEERVMRGGSHLCHRSWCHRYRLPARSKNTPDSTTSNIGFRCVMDP